MNIYLAGNHKYYVPLPKPCNDLQTIQTWMFVSLDEQRQHLPVLWRYLPCFQRMQGMEKNLPLSLKLFSIQAAVHWLERELREAFLHVQWLWFFLVPVLNFFSLLYRNLKNWFNQHRFLLSNKTFIFFWEEETVKDGKEFHLPVLLVAGSSS